MTHLRLGVMHARPGSQSTSMGQTKIQRWVKRPRNLTIGHIEEPILPRDESKNSNGKF